MRVSILLFFAFFRPKIEIKRVNKLINFFIVFFGINRKIRERFYFSDSTKKKENNHQLITNLKMPISLQLYFKKKSFLEYMLCACIRFDMNAI